MSTTTENGDNTELTVEKCLAELREMFPDVEIQFTARTTAQGWRVWLGLRGGNFYGGTLNEAMADVREWKESQQENRSEQNR